MLCSRLFENVFGLVALPSRVVSALAARVNERMTLTCEVGKERELY